MSVNRELAGMFGKGDSTINRRVITLSKKVTLFNLYSGC